MIKKKLSKSPTPIGWVDYLDIWTESNKSKFPELDFFGLLVSRLHMPLPFKRSCAQFF